MPWMQSRDFGIKQFIRIDLTLSQTSPGFYISAVKVFWKHCRKRRNLLVTSNFSISHSVFYWFGELSAIFIRPSKTGRIMGSPMAGTRVGGWAASTSLSGAYLQNYSSYGYEISWVDRSHQGGVQCAGIITLASLIFQLLPFVFFFILEFCLEHISKTILARVMKFHGRIDLIKGECSAQES